MKNFKKILVGAALTALLMIQNVYAASFQTTYDDFDFKGFLTLDDDLANATAIYEDVSGNAITYVTLYAYECLDSDASTIKTLSGNDSSSKTSPLPLIVKRNADSNYSFYRAVAYYKVKNSDGSLSKTLKASN